MPTSFSYESYIRAPVKKVWSTFTDGKKMRQCWFGITQEAQWKKGGEWKLVAPGGQICDYGKIFDILKGRKIVIAWHHNMKPAFIKEGPTRATLTFKQEKTLTHIVITHTSSKHGSKFISEGVSKGWPMIISGLKSLLETGKPLIEFSKW